jgi:hypothetical protein
MTRTLWMGLFLVCACILISVDATAQSRSGTYRNRNGEIRIREMTGSSRYLSFSIEVGNPSPPLCIGNLRGRATWLEESIAEYNSDFNEGSCRLTFTFSGNRVVVRETNCDEHHGVSCSFEGTFTRAGRARRRGSR